MKTINKIALLGVIGRIEAKPSQSGEGLFLLSFSVATKRSKKSKNDEKNTEVTDWFNCVIFGKGADIASNLLEVGDCVYVDGRMQSERFIDKNNQEKTVYQVVVSDFSLTSKSKKNQVSERARDNNGGIRKPDQAQRAYSYDHGIDDDIPF